MASKKVSKYTVGQFIDSGTVYPARYSKWGKDNPIKDEEERRRLQNDPTFGEMAEEYYNIITSGIEIGWSQFFHFASYAPGQNTDQTRAFALHQFACKMGLKPGMKVLDLGCGIGGPTREIARFVSCEVVSVSVTQYHVNRAIELTLQTGMSRQCTFIQGNFMDLSFPDASFDAAYGINALCYAPSMAHLYAGVNRILKPNAPFGVIEWIMTPVFNPECPEHVRIRNRMEAGCGIVKMPTVEDCQAAFKRTGFEVYFEEDRVEQWRHLSEAPPFDPSDPNVRSLSSVTIPARDGKSSYLAPLPKPPFHPIESTSEAPIPPPFRPFSFMLKGQTELCTNAEDRRVASHLTPRFRRLADWFYWFLEKVHLAPPGSVATLKTMEYMVDAMIEGGDNGTFSPLWWFVARKVSEVEDEELKLPWVEWLKKQKEQKTLDARTA